MAELIVVADDAGLIGVFDDAAEMETAFAAHGIGGDIQRQLFPAGADGGQWAWLVPLAADGHIVFASKDREAADEVRKRYAEAGLVFDDEIDYWQQRVNTVRPEAVARYAPLPETDAELASRLREDDERSAALMRPRPGGPLEKAIADNAPLVGIGHFVVAADDFDIAGATGAVAGATDAVAGATKDVASTTKDVAGATEDVSAATDTVTSATDAVAGATDTVSTATDTVASTTKDVAGATDTVASATADVSAATDTVASATEDVAGATSTVSTATDAVAGATSTVSTATDTVTGATTDVATATDTVTGATEDVAAATDTVAKAAVDHSVS
jgi:hypothetical protein